MLAAMQVLPQPTYASPMGGTPAFLFLIAIQVLRRVRDEAIARRAGVLFLGEGPHSSSSAQLYSAVPLMHHSAIHHSDMHHCPDALTSCTPLRSQPEALLWRTSLYVTTLLHHPPAALP